MTMLNVALIFGGRSVGHDVTIKSAQAIYGALDRKRNSPILVGIAEDGKWWLQESMNEFPLHVEPSGSQITFLPGAGGKALVHRSNKDDKIIQIDVVLPIMPEGILQGVLETAQVPFVGSRMPAPAICMDKQITKRILRDAGLPIARYLALTDREEVEFQCAQETLCSRSLFVKPATLHDSIGASKVTCESEFRTAVDLAFSCDSKVLVEEYVEARELVAAVLQDVEQTTRLNCSWPGEFILSDEHGFLSYQAKFSGRGVTFKAKAELGEAVADRVRALSCEAFRVIGCEALARVDFFMRQNGELLINEVGLPSLTPYATFSRIMEASGIPYSDLVQRLFEDAIKHSARARTAYTEHGRRCA
ncbi:D-alanine--D-alanine ligase [Bradyrhizobium iriomotense]|uniref:D-alanine--D-alanine ligase n=1 Tax=Bradyrhizobium iriomotense TaxID=441950 RepID=A0ABQ6BJ90_9BRAD|nr:D-alanine--D-alanine ligase [Bradyrhizobium iriomotense]GLR92183.1 D-alanine--D-alanine ligase A [Bradyrhizobium iriomotense]